VQSLRPFYTGSRRFSIAISQTAGETHGSLIHRLGIRLFRRHGGADLRLRKTEEAAMNWIYVVSGLLALAIFVYLIVALFFPEKF
jgi:K+-transporting ATPase KdpF subunit